MINKNEKESLVHSTVFRPDVEILRGLAVALVVAYHLKISAIASGFIGVDVFFVLSGFLMASAITSTTKESIFNFYERRARRVLPAAIIIAILFLITAPILFLPFETQEVNKSLTAILLLVPNFLFWLDNSYFDDSSFRPLLHYWSLGVEFQYYLVFPLLLWVFRAKFILFVLLLATTALGSILLTELSSRTAFFLLPTRIWEFLIGYLAYQILLRNWRPCTTYSDFISLTALASLLGLSFADIPEAKFPGVYAFTPVILTFIYLVFGLEKTKLLPLGLDKLLRFLGKFSYSIYLVHFPVIFYFTYNSFYRWKELSIKSIVYATIVTLILAVCSYYFIEEPFRNKKKTPWRKFKLSILVMYSIGAVIILVNYLTNNFSYFYSKEQHRIFYAMSDRGKWFCNTSSIITDFKKPTCKLTTGQKDNTILLVGDSHMDAIKSIFIENAQKNNTNVEIIKNSCILGKGICSAEKILDAAKQNNARAVVLHGYSPSRFDFKEIEILAINAKKASITIHFINPIPTYRMPVPTYLYMKSTLESVDDMIITRTQYFNKADKSFENFISRGQEVGIYFYDPTAYLCNTTCLIEGAEGIYYHDAHHLTLTGAKLLNSIATDIYTFK